MAWATWLTPLEAGQSQRYEVSSDKDGMSKRRDNYNDGEVRSIRGGQVLTIIMQDSVVHHNRFLFLLFFFSSFGGGSYYGDAALCVLCLSVDLILRGSNFYACCRDS